MPENKEQFIWEEYGNIDRLIAVKTETMARFLADFAKGKADGRYIYHYPL